MHRTKVIISNFREHFDPKLCFYTWLKFDRMSSLRWLLLEILEIRKVTSTTVAKKFQTSLYDGIVMTTKYSSQYNSEYGACKPNKPGIVNVICSIKFEINRKLSPFTLKGIIQLKFRFPT